MSIPFGPLVTPVFFDHFYLFEKSLTDPATFRSSHLAMRHAHGALGMAGIISKGDSGYIELNVERIEKEANGSVS